MTGLRGIPYRAIVALAGSAAILVASAIPVAAASPSGYFNESAPGGTIAQDSAQHIIATLAVGVGTHWVTATATLDSTSATPETVTGDVACRIRASSSGGILDVGRWSLSGLQDGRGVVSMYLTGLFGTGGTWVAVLECAGNMTNTTVSIHDVRMSAMFVQHANSPLVKTNNASINNIAGDSTFHTITSLDLPKGRWWVVGTTNVANSSTAGANDVTCRVKLSTTDQDRTQQGLQDSLETGWEGRVAVQVAHRMSSAGTAKLQCRGTRDFATDQTRIVALQLGKMTKRQFGGSSSTLGSGTPRLITGYRAAAMNVNVGNYANVAVLPVPEGMWLISAKAWLNDSAATRVDCTLSADTHENATYSFGGAGSGSAGLYLQTAVSKNSSFNAVLECKAAAGGASLQYVRITAVKVDSLTFDL